MRLRDKVLATMKSRDTEGAFELYVTRTPGYLWALLFRRLGVHPIAVTLASIAIGAAAGYFFYFPSREMNLIGMLLLVWANWYDCADGQLARMTGKKTLIGRILDGFAGDVGRLRPAFMTRQTGRFTATGQTAYASSSEGRALSM